MHSILNFARYAVPKYHIPFMNGHEHKEGQGVVELEGRRLLLTIVYDLVGVAVATLRTYEQTVHCFISFWVTTHNIETTNTVFFRPLGVYESSFAVCGGFGNIPIVEDS